MGGACYYLGRIQKNKMEELAGMKKNGKTTKESTEPILSEFMEFVDEFKEFVTSVNSQSIYNVMQKMNEAIQKKKDIKDFPEDFGALHC